jgi:hypothetical protein
VYRDLAILAIGFALAGCSGRAPAPLRSSAATSAGQPPDVAMAAATDLKVLVPRSLGEEPDAAGGDPLEVLARTIDREVTVVPGKKSVGRIVIYADTTLDYGCRCPPFVFAPFWSSGRSNSYVLPIFAKGVPDAPRSKQGLYRFAGHFDGRRMTGFQWLRLRGEEAREGMSEYAHKAPVFVVEGWCFEPVEAFADPSAEEIYGPTLKQMEKAGRFCPGARFPSTAARDGS